jgi:hypothetical protein
MAIGAVSALWRSPRPKHLSVERKHMLEEWAESARTLVLRREAGQGRSRSCSVFPTPTRAVTGSSRQLRANDGYEGFSSWRRAPRRLRHEGSL